MFNKLYDVILYVYALSLLFYFSDFVDANRSAKRIGAGLLVFVWVLQSCFLWQSLSSSFNLEYLPKFECWFSISWLLITISLVLRRFVKSDMIVFFINVIGFSVLALNVFSNRSVAVPLGSWDSARNLLIVHISLVCFSFAALAIAAICSAIYLFLHGRLKYKKWSHSLIRMPSLDTVDRYAYRIGIVGIPLLALSILVAVVSIVIENRLSYLWDWKVLSSFISLNDRMARAHRVYNNSEGWSVMAPKRGLDAVVKQALRAAICSQARSAHRPGIRRALHEHQGSLKRKTAARGKRDRRARHPSSARIVDRSTRFTPQALRARLCRRHPP